METNADMEADTDVDANADVEVAMTPDPRAWRVAIALAHECGLDWARCRNTCPSDRWRTGGWRCVRALGHAGMCESYEHGGERWSDATPVPAPWDADAYLADCARRKVEPGPLPSLEWTGGDVRWRVEPEGVSLAVGRLYASKLTGAEAWVVSGGVTDEQLALLSRLATAAAKAMVP